VKRGMTIAAMCAAAISLLIAGAAQAGEGPTNPTALAAKQCAAEKKADKAAFTATYGKHAMRECIRAATGEVAEEAKNASQECRAERDADPELFATTYGTNGNGKNAFGKCVSSKVGEEIAEAVEEFTGAAAQCREERDADPAAFMETWGTNAPAGENAQGAKRNAFGKCVSATAQAQEDEEETPAS
jgi:hypothetical protein